VDLAMEIFGCNIVDTYFHTSARTGPSGPNKQDFLLHERAAAPLSAGKQLRSEGPSHLERAIL